MELHHSKHFKAYIDNYNAARIELAQAVLQGDVVKQIQLERSIKFNGGGYITHSIFFKNLAPKQKGGGQLGNGKLSEAIKGTFGTMEGMKKAANKVLATLQGSGWVWLAFEPQTKGISFITTANQDILPTQFPIIGIDLWEHAFYLQFLNDRAAYFDKVWEVIDFDEAEKRYEAALNGKSDI